MTARPLPQDPMIRSLIAQARQAQLNRRTLLAGAGAGVSALALAACSTGGAAAKPTAAADESASAMSETTREEAYGACLVRPLLRGRPFYGR